MSANSLIPVDSGHSRRRFLQLGGYGVAGLALTQLIAACGGSSDAEAGATSSDGAAAKTLSLQLSWVEDAEFSPLYLADNKQRYSAEGISLKMVTGGPDIGAIEGIVAGGSTQLGIATDITSIIAAAADGNPLVCIGTLYQENLNVFMSPPDKPITSVKEMAGKKIGASQGTQTKIDAMFKLAGLEPDYTFVPVGYGPDALINGDCDLQAVFITDEPAAYEATTGKKPVIFSYTDAGLPAYTLVIFTTKKFLADNRDAVKSFLKATREGFDDWTASPDTGATLAVDTYGKDAGLVLADEKRKAAAYLALATSDTTKSKGYLYMDSAYVSGPIFTGMKAAGLGTAPIEDVLDMSLLDELNKE